MYSTITNVYGVKNIKTAEFTKLLENTFRSVNIGLVNELFTFCDKFNINIFDAVKAANTKPFGYMPFVPGPGLRALYTCRPLLFNLQSKSSWNKN